MSSRANNIIKDINIKLSELIDVIGQDTDSILTHMIIYGVDGAKNLIPIENVLHTISNWGIIASAENMIYDQVKDKEFPDRVILYEILMQRYRDRE